jgi:hypothetical protein
MKRKPLIITAVVVVFVLAIGVTAYMFRSTPDCVCNKKAQAHLQADELLNAYELDEQEANANYLGKVITVTGTIAELSADDQGRTVIAFSSQSFGAVMATLCENENINNLEPNQTISIKGECSGYTFDVVLSKCCLQ